MLCSNPGGGHAGLDLVSVDFMKHGGIFKGNADCTEVFALSTDFTTSCIRPDFPVPFIGSK